MWLPPFPQWVKVQQRLSTPRPREAGQVLALPSPLAAGRMGPEENAGPGAQRAGLPFQLWSLTGPAEGPFFLVPTPPPCPFLPEGVG